MQLHLPCQRSHCFKTYVAKILDGMTPYRTRISHAGEIGSTSFPGSKTLKSTAQRFKPINFGGSRLQSAAPFRRCFPGCIWCCNLSPLTNIKGDIHCSFIIGKSRLSPLKQLTIPPLEISAAVVATRLQDRMIMKEIGISVDQSIF